MPVVMLLAASLALAGWASQAEPTPKQVVTPRDVRAEIVAASVYAYKGPCPCPYSKNGACKGDSAYERGKGAQPKCFKAKVDAEDMKRWRELRQESTER